MLNSMREREKKKKSHSVAFDRTTNCACASGTPPTRRCQHGRQKTGGRVAPKLTFRLSQVPVSLCSVTWVHFRVSVASRTASCIECRCYPSPLACCWRYCWTGSTAVWRVCGGSTGSRWVSVRGSTLTEVPRVVVVVVVVVARPQNANQKQPREASEGNLGEENAFGCQSEIIFCLSALWTFSHFFSPRLSRDYSRNCLFIG